MESEKIRKKIEEAFVGHFVTVLSSRSYGDVTLMKIAIGGSTFRQEDFDAMRAALANEFAITYIIENNVLKITLIRE